MLNLMNQLMNQVIILNDWIGALEMLTQLRGVACISRACIGFANGATPLHRMIKPPTLLLPGQ